MTTQEALLAAILADPDDDLPRLAYADWCEELGNQARADLIRVQLAIWNAERTCRCGRTNGGHPQSGGQHHNGPCAANRLRFNVNGQELLARQIEASMLKLIDSTHPNTPGQSFVWQRGFIGEVHCPLGWWLQHGSAYVRKYPLRRVLITDCRPELYFVVSEGRFVWEWRHTGEAISHDQQVIPYAIWLFFQLPSYDNQKQAMEALSQACLTWAKAQSPQEPSA